MPEKRVNDRVNADRSRSIHENDHWPRESLTIYVYVNAVGIRRVLVGRLASVSAGILLIRIADDKPIEL